MALICCTFKQIASHDIFWRFSTILAFFLNYIRKKEKLQNQKKYGYFNNYKKPQASADCHSGESVAIETVYFSENVHGFRLLGISVRFGTYYVANFVILIETTKFKMYFIFEKIAS